MTDAEASDRSLLDAWAEGDAAAGNQLVRRHFSTVYRFFRSKVPEAADDLTQASFLACVEGRARFRGDAKFRTYLLGIARNQLLYHFRKQARRGDLFEVGDRSIADLTNHSPSKLIAASERQQILLAALRRLPLDLQIALELYYWEDMSQAEVAEVQGVAEGTAKSRLHEARARLRDEVTKLATSPKLRDAALRDLDDQTRSLRNVLAKPDPEQG